MSYHNDPTTGQGEQYDRTSNRNPMVAAIQFPFEQAAAFQRTTAGMVLGGLELVESTQRVGADLTESMVRSYRDTIEEVTDTQRRAGQYASQLTPSQQQSRQQPPQHTQPPQQQPRAAAEPPTRRTQQLQQPTQDPGAQYQGRGYDQESPRQSTEPAELQQAGPAGQPQPPQ